MLREALSGAFSRKSIKVVRPSAKRASMKSASADIASEGISNGQREAHRNRGVDGVAARFQDRHTDVGRQRLLRHHHGMLREDRLPAQKAPSHEKSARSGAGSHNLRF